MSYARFKCCANLDCGLFSRAFHTPVSRHTFGVLLAARSHMCLLFGPFVVRSRGLVSFQRVLYKLKLRADCCLLGLIHHLSLSHFPLSLSRAKRVGRKESTRGPIFVIAKKKMVVNDNAMSGLRSIFVSFALYSSRDFVTLWFSFSDPFLS